jgi:lysophospholipase L1-like esterase
MANYNLSQTGDEVQAYIDSIPVIDVTGTLSGSNIVFATNPYSQIAANYAAGCSSIVRLTVGTAVYLLRVTQYDGTNYTAAEMTGAHNVVATIGSSAATATIDAGIDATPTQGSNNLVKSGGVSDSLEPLGDVLDNYIRVPSVNLFDKDSVTTGNGVRKDNGNLLASSTFCATDYIDVSSEEISSLYIYDYGTYSGVYGFAFYNANKVFTHGDGQALATKQEGDAYIRVSIANAKVDTAMIVVGTAVNVPSEYVPFGDTYKLQVSTENITDEAITSDKLSEGAVAESLVDSKEILYPFNLIDFANLVPGTFIGSSGNVATTTTLSYRATDFIPLNGKKVFWGTGIGPYGSGNGGALYDANKNLIRVFQPSGSGSYDTSSESEGAAYIRLTLTGAYSLFYVVYADADGNNPFASGATGLTTDSVNFYNIEEVNHSHPDVAFDKSVVPQLLPAYSRTRLDGFTKKFNSISAGNYVEFGSAEYPSYIKAVHTLSFKAESIGALTGNDYIRMGVGYSQASSKAVKITDTQIILERYDANNGYVSNLSFTHGLTISDFIMVELDMGWHTGCVRITTRNGIFSQEFQYSQYSYTETKQETMGRAFIATSVSMSDVKLSQYSNAFRSPVWIIGDSYTSFYSNRWTWQLVNSFKVDNFLVSGYAGAESKEMEAELEMLLQFGTPKYLVWCMGMNDLAPVWLNYVKKVEQICARNGIDIIFQTIPKNNSAKNEINLYVTSSQNRYIDFVSAVMRNGTWYSDMDEDGTHPNILGAQVLAGQVLNDFPELIK